MKNTFKFIYIFITTLCILMQFTNSRLIHHQQSTIDQQNLAYYQALSQEQRDAKIQLTNLKKQIQFLHQTLDQVQNIPSIKTIVLQQGLADQRDILYTIQQDLTIPIKYKTIQCKNLTQQQSQSIGQMVDKIHKQTQNLKLTIFGLSNSQQCSICDQLKRQYNWDIIYLRELKAMLEPCPQLKPSEVDIALADLTKYNKISNLNTDSQWIYGNTTQADYYMSIVNQNQGQNVSKCSIQKPFIAQNQTQCSQCPQQSPIFDISLEKCIQCPQKTEYDSKVHKCLVNGINCGEKQYNLQTEQCQCPSNKPYWNGQVCQACILPEYFDKQSQKCLKCPTGQVYDIQLLKCAPRCQATHIFDQKIQQCACPSVTPFDNGQSCVACYLPQYWNLDTKVCQYCKDGFYYDIQTLKCMQCPESNPKTVDGKCHPCPQGTVYDLKTNQCGDSSRICPSNYKYNQQQGICQCPQQNPFDTGSQCVHCYLPKYWSHDAKQCLSCPNGKIYDFQIKDCVYCPTQKPVIIGYVCGQCPQGFVFDMASSKCIQGSIKCLNTYLYNSQQDKCSCPQYQPLDDGQKCVTCYLPHYWNFDDKQCNFCPQRTYYDLDKNACLYCPQDKPLFKDHICLACQQNTFFKKDQNLCLFSQDYCSSNYELNEQLLTCKCPLQSPYDDGKKCNSCSSPSYWNQQTKLCQSCQNNFFYNYGTQECERCPESHPIFKKSKCQACKEGTKFVLEKQACVSNNQYCQLVFKDRKYVFNNQTLKCQCPKQTPFDNGKQCISCFLPKYWSHDTKQCLFCPQNQYYNTKLLKCEHCPGQTPILSKDGIKCLACPQNSVFKIDQNACISYDSICSENYEYNPEKDICQCPKNAPFDDGTQCVSCFLPRYWSFEKSQCLTCPNNYYYDTNIKKCAKCPLQTPILKQGEFKCSACPQKTVFNQETNNCKSLSEFCSSNYIYKIDNKQCVCPQDKPFDNGKECVSCYLPKYWNHNSLSCEQCPVNTVYNTSLKKCIKCPSQTPITDQSKMKCVSCSQEYLFDIQHNKCVSYSQFCHYNQVYNVINMKCECPKTKPFFTGSDCISCYLPQYWNYDTKQCLWCQQNYVYNTQTKKCQQCPSSTPITDASKMKCIAKNSN